jgi:hypothetical protein
MRALLLILLSLSCSILRADEHEDRFIAEIQSRIAANKGESAKLEKQIKAMKAGRVVRGVSGAFQVVEARGAERYVWRSKEDKEKGVAEAEAKLVSLSKKESLIPDLPFAKSFSVGQIGNLPMQTTDSVFVAIGDTGTQANQTTFYAYKVFQVIDANNALILQEKGVATFADRQPETSSEVFWLAAKTAGMADGTRIALQGMHRVVGTRQYEAQKGPRTVFVVEPFDASDLIDKATK